MPSDPAVSATISFLDANPSSPGAEFKPLTGGMSAGGNLLLEPIGRGGMGAVYRGRNTQLNRELAVKVLLDEHCNRPELVQRFWEEAQIAGQLQHPGVAPVYELGRLADERPYFTMKLVQGDTLGALLAKRGNPQDELGRFLAIFAQICQTVAYAHSQGVIHRDLKPLNVMVGAFGEVQVMDWGLAKVVRATPLPETGTAPSPEVAPSDAGAGGSTARQSRTGVVGTPAYMPPEQARGDDVDERADVFSLGAMLTEILTGQPPYTGANRGEIWQCAQRADLGRALQRLDEARTDGDLVALAKRCLASEPGDRPRDAAAVAQAMTEHLANVEQRAREAEQARAAAQARAEEVRKRLRVTIGLAAAVVTLILVAAGSGLVVQQQAVAHREAVLRRDLQERSTIQNGLDRAELLVRQSRWKESRTALEQIAGQLTAASPIDLRERLTKAQSELALVDRLDAIRFSSLQHLSEASAHGGTQFKTIDDEYAAAFAEAKVAKVGDDPAIVARRIKDTTIVPPLLAALDAWASKTAEDERRAWLLSIARLVDPHPDRDPLRDPALWLDTQRLTKRLRDSKELELTPTLATALAFRIWGPKPTPEAAEVAFRILGTANRQHPDDFWPAFSLGHLLDRAEQEERASGYYRAAVALRPDAERAWYWLGCSLMGIKGDKIPKGQWEEIIGCYQRAIELDPQRADSQGLLGYALGGYGDFEAGIRHLEISIKLDSNPINPARMHLPKFLTSLSLELHTSGQASKAISTLQRAIALDPAIHERVGVLADWLMKADRMDEGIGVLEELVQEHPKEVHYRDRLILGLGKVRRIDDALKHSEKALELDPDNPDLLGTQGVLLTTLGRFEEGRDVLRRALDSPKAKDLFKRAQWTHFRKECERMVVIDQSLAAYLRGEFKPSSVEERFDMASLCLQHRGNYVAAVRLFEEAFATDSRLTDPRYPARYDAARAAALAAAGEGSDTPSADMAQERAILRKKARDWIGSDLSWLQGKPGRAEAGFRASLLQSLQSLLAEPKLAAVRETGQLKLLPESEREEWAAFWKDVRALTEQLNPDN